MIKLTSKTGIVLSDRTFTYPGNAKKYAQKLVNEGVRKSVYLVDSDTSNVLDKVS